MIMRCVVVMGVMMTAAMRHGRQGRGWADRQRHTFWQFGHTRRGLSRRWATGELSSVSQAFLTVAHRIWLTLTLTDRGEEDEKPGLGG